MKNPKELIGNLYTEFRKIRPKDPDLRFKKKVDDFIDRKRLRKRRIRQGVEFCYNVLDAVMRLIQWLMELAKNIIDALLNLPLRVISYLIKRLQSFEDNEKNRSKLYQFMIFIAFILSVIAVIQWLDAIGRNYIPSNFTIYATVIAVVLWIMAKIIRIKKWTESEISTRIKSLIAEYFHEKKEEVTPNKSFSLDFSVNEKPEEFNRLVNEIQKVFEIKFETSELIDISTSTVSNLESLIYQKNHRSLVSLAIQNLIYFTKLNRK